QKHLLGGLTITGLYHPTPVLEVLREILLDQRHADLRNQVAKSLCRLRFVQAPLVDAFVAEMGKMSINLVQDTWSGNEGTFVWRHVETLGLYNNAVNQAFRYPQMRDKLLHPGFLGLAEARDVEEFVRGYVRHVLKLLRITNYE